MRTNQQCTSGASDLDTLLVEIINETSVRRAKVPSGESPSRPTKLKYKNLANIDKGELQHKPHTRIIAEDDPRNAQSMHAKNGLQNCSYSFCRKKQTKTWWLQECDGTPIYTNIGHKPMLYSKTISAAAYRNMQGKVEI